MHQSRHVLVPPGRVRVSTIGHGTCNADRVWFWRVNQQVQIGHHAGRHLRLQNSVPQPLVMGGRRRLTRQHQVGLHLELLLRTAAAVQTDYDWGIMAAAVASASNSQITRRVATSGTRQVSHIAAWSVRPSSGRSQLPHYGGCAGASAPSPVVGDQVAAHLGAGRLGPRVGELLQFVEEIAGLGVGGAQGEVVVRRQACSAAGRASQVGPWATGGQPAGKRQKEALHDGVGGLGGEGGGACAAGRRGRAPAPVSKHSPACMLHRKAARASACLVCKQPHRRAGECRLGDLANATVVQGAVLGGADGT